MNEARKYLIIFDGPKDSSEDTLRRIKACFLADLELPINEINRIFVDPPSDVISVNSKSDAKKFHIALTAAGAKVRVEILGEDEETEEEEEDPTSVEITVDSGEAKEEKPAKVWELSIEDEEEQELPLPSSLQTEEEEEQDLTIPEDEPQAVEVSKETTQFTSAGISLEDDSEETPAVATPPPAPKPTAPPTTPSTTPPAQKKEKATEILLRPEVEEPKTETEKNKEESPAPTTEEAQPSAEEDVTPRVLNKWSGIASPPPKAESQTNTPDSSGEPKAIIIPTSNANIRRLPSKKSKFKEFAQLIIPFAILQTLVTVTFFYLSGSDADKSQDILTEVEESDKESSANSAVPTKEPTPLPTETPEGPVTPFTAQVEKDNSAFSFDCEIEVTKLRNCQISVTTSQPPELTPEEIVRGAKRSPWVTKIESDAAKFEDGVAKSEARVFIDYDGRKDRIKANVSFTTRSVLGSNQKLLEVTILSGTDTPAKEDSHFIVTAPKDSPYILSLRQSTKLPVAKDPGIVVPEITPLPTVVTETKKP